MIMNTVFTSGKKKCGNGALQTRGEDTFLNRFLGFFFSFFCKYILSLKNIFLKEQMQCSLRLW